MVHLLFSSFVCTMYTGTSIVDMHSQNLVNILFSIPLIECKHFDRPSSHVICFVIRNQFFCGFIFPLFPFNCPILFICSVPFYRRCKLFLFIVDWTPMLKVSHFIFEHQRKRCDWWMFGRRLPLHIESKEVLVTRAIFQHSTSYERKSNLEKINT